MNPSDFTQLRAGRSGCPSDLVLDRYTARELPAGQAETARAHLASCTACAAHVEDNRAAAHPRAQHMLARIRAGAEQRATLWERARGWLRPGPLVGLSTVAALAGALIVLWHPGAPGGVGEGPEQIRMKGGAVLHVHRLTAAGGSEEVLSGDRLEPGTHLRFVVDLAAEGHISVVGVEAGGRLYTAWPMDAATDTQRPAGQGQVLPGAVVLDDSRGEESLYLVHCPAPLGPPRCRPGGSSAQPACQKGCTLARFVLHKEPTGSRSPVGAAVHNR